MALCHVQWYSNVLLKQVTSTVIVPDVGTPPFATLYLLHGLSDDHSIWSRRTRIEFFVRDLPLMVVMPDGYRGFYTDNDQGPAYGRYMIEDVIAFHERTFPAKRSRAARGIGGLSMGGYGALRLALSHPDMFVSAHSHSGAVLHGSRRPPRTGDNAAEMRRIFGGDPRGTDHDLLHLAEKAKSSGRLPRLHLDCGHNDFLIEDNRAFHRQLTEMGLPHEYQEHPGIHDWNYWEANIGAAIAFHAKAMRLTTPPRPV